MFFKASEEISYYKWDSNPYRQQQKKCILLHVEAALEALYCTCKKKDQLDASKYMAKLDDEYGLEEHEILPRQEEKRKGK